MSKVTVYTKDMGAISFDNIDNIVYPDNGSGPLSLFRAEDDNTDDETVIAIFAAGAWTYVECELEVTGA